MRIFWRGVLNTIYSTSCWSTSASGICFRDFLHMHKLRFGRDIFKCKFSSGQFFGEKMSSFRWNLKSEIWDLRAQIWDLRADIWELRSEIWDLRSESWDLRAEIWDLRSESWDLRSGRSAVRPNQGKQSNPQVSTSPPSDRVIHPNTWSPACGLLLVTELKVSWNTSLPPKCRETPAQLHRLPTP